MKLQVEYAFQQFISRSFVYAPSPVGPRVDPSHMSTGGHKRRASGKAPHVDPRIVNGSVVSIDFAPLIPDFIRTVSLSRIENREAISHLSTVLNYKLLQSKGCLTLTDDIGCANQVNGIEFSDSV